MESMAAEEYSPPCGECDLEAKRGRTMLKTMLRKNGHRVAAPYLVYRETGKAIAISPTGRHRRNWYRKCQSFFVVTKRNDAARLGRGLFQITRSIVST